MIKGSKNKGDWSEFYALVKLLAKGRLEVANENLDKVEDFHFPIIKIKRQEKRDNKKIDDIDYVINDKNGKINVDIYIDKVLKKTISRQKFQEEADLLLEAIPNSKGAQFNILHGEQFLNDLYLEKLAAPSTDVTDIKIEIHDTHTSINQEMGFSIKSYLGGAPTLLNASYATNFVYEISGISETQKDSINSIDTREKIKDRITEIQTAGGQMNFVKCANEIFAANLMMIDSRMEEIIAYMLLYHYLSNEKSCNKVVEHLEEDNPLNYPRKGFYVYKFKKFLCAKALGMDPSKVWEGIDEANGGYIAVKSDGEVLAYHLYNRDSFEKYLFDNTHFERASTSRHQYASIYEENNKMYMNLNLQIRFYDNH